MDKNIWYEDCAFCGEERQEEENYSREETAAMRCPGLMTQELFEKCLSTAVRLDDFDCYFRLVEEFPEFSEAYDRKVELLIRYSGEPPVF